VNQGTARLPRGFENRLDLSRHATPRPLRATPIHKWFVFPHSFSDVLVDSLIDHWDLDEESRIYDPFVGAGTTLLAAKARHIAAIGSDISPLSVFVTNAKVARYSLRKLKSTWNNLQQAMKSLSPASRVQRTPFLAKALGLETHRYLAGVRRLIESKADRAEKRFFVLALLRVLPHYSRALPDGGWFRWRRVQSQADTVPARFARTVNGMIADLQSLERNGQKGDWRAYEHDARLPLKGHGLFDAVICSPPYPNRHDYTRIFTTELLFQFLDESGLKRLRYDNLRSHVEARTVPCEVNGWRPPRAVEAVVHALADARDKRVPRMIRGYFEDMHLTLAALKMVVRPGGHLALVVGNVQHAGVHVPVDSILVDLGKQIGFEWDKTWVIRLRGNSAQQMGRYGRKPARESVVIFRRP
jgi:hypothetical protein